MQIVDVDYFGEKIGMMFSCNDMRSRKVAANDFISYKIKIFKNRFCSFMANWIVCYIHSNFFLLQMIFVGVSLLTPRDARSPFIHRYS